MEQDYSNYDMLDKLIANTRKARAWTIFWIAVLCLLAGVIVWMAYTISEKEKVIATQSHSIDDKNQLIDSLMLNCKNEKSEIINKLDSALTKTETLVNKIETKKTFTQVSDSQKTNVIAVNTSISRLRADLSKIKNDIKKEKLRIFIQYNSPDDLARVKQLATRLRKNTDYFVAPSEYVNTKFNTLIKSFNYKDSDTEDDIKAALTNVFQLDKNVRVNYLTNTRIKPTIEIWIGSK